MWLITNLSTSILERTNKECNQSSLSFLGLGIGVPPIFLISLSCSSRSPRRPAPFFHRRQPGRSRLTTNRAPPIVAGFFFMSACGRGCVKRDLPWPIFRFSKNLSYFLISPIEKTTPVGKIDCRFGENILWPGDDLMRRGGK